MKRKILFMAAVLFSSTKLFAQKDSAQSMSEVVVTATKYPVKQSLTGKVVTVISQEQLKKSSGQSVAQVLNAQTGIIVNGSTSAPGTNQDVYLRGAAAGKTLLLIDGIPVYDVSGISGAYDLNFLQTNQVERIEIVKGSQSTLYGSDAVAGVINIITKTGGAKKISGSADVSAGSYNTWRENVSVSGTLAKTNYNFQYTQENSNGFSAANDKTGQANFDKDGNDQYTLRGKIVQKISKSLSINAHGQYSRYKADVDAGPFADDRDYTVTNKNILAGAGATLTQGRTDFRANYYYNDVRRNYLDDSLQRGGGFAYYNKGNYDGKSHFAELYSTTKISERSSVLAGVEYRQQGTDQSYLSVSSFGPFETAPLGADSTAVKQFSAYASFLLNTKSGFNLELGGRYNNFSKYGDAFTYSLNPSFLILPSTKIFANLSTGFKTPSLYQIYSEYRNPSTELKPEKTLNLEGGISYEKSGYNVRAVYFLRNTKDLLSFYSSGAPNYSSYYVNADKQKVKGLELEASGKFDILSLAINYTNLDGKIETKNNAKDTSFFNLYRRPRQVINLQAGVDICKALFVRLSMQSVGNRYEAVYGGAPVNLPAYAIWNFYSQYSIGNKARFYIDLKNITDASYQEVRGYNSRGFNITGGVTLTF